MAEATIIDGKAIAAKLRGRIGDAVAGLRAQHDVVPGLATVLVGADAASQVYVRSKSRACAAAGIASFDMRLPADIEHAALLAEIDRLNRDERIDGILVQLPLPPGLDPHAIAAAVDPAKDVDGFHPVSIGRLWSGRPSLVPCTPQGCMRLLHSVHPDLTGAEAVVVGRSNIVGKPVGALLLAADCTVSWVHSKTRDAAALCRRADVVVAAIGRPHAVAGNWIKPGATVIDVGINQLTEPDGNSRIVGDVNFDEARTVAGAITPVPGGVGPMTIACVLTNTLVAACRRRGLSDPDL